MDDKVRQKLLDFRDSTRVKVRFNDTDAMGIVHFKNYLVYFDDGFVSFMNSLLAPKRIEETVQEGVAFGVKKIEIVYEGSVQFGDYVIVESQIKTIGKSSLTFQHSLYRETNNSLIAKVECVRLAMEVKSNKLVSVDEFFKKYLKFNMGWFKKN
ncbi:MAG: acyl-CoA thioesterase [Candidatus Thorarchaeota archaeon]